MGEIPLKKGEWRDVEIIDRAMKRLSDRGILFFCMDDTIILVRSDEKTDDYDYGKFGREQGMPNQDAIVTELDVVCQAGGW